MRRCLILLAVAGTALGLAGVPAQALPAGAAPAAEALDAEALDASAVREARRTGKPVEVTSRTTEKSQVTANPNGTFTLRSNARPVRVHKDGNWRSTDTTLRPGANGVLAPVAAALDVAFSSGGDAPLIRLADGDRVLTFDWPDPLPKPVVTGSTATYPDVLPGVDLVLTADVDTYHETLVIQDAQAARNSALANLRFTVEATNLALRVAEDGSLSATDRSGKTIFAGSTPVMWDSARDERRGPAPTAVDPGSGRISRIPAGARHTPNKSAVPAGTSSMELTLTPDPAALTGPDVTYPVFLDPQMSRNSTAWVEVTDNGWHYYNAAMDAQVGRCWDHRGECGGRWVARSYFQMPTQDLQWRNNYAPTVWSASFYALQKHASHACASEPVNLYDTFPVDGGTRWPGPITHFLEQQWSNAGDQCGGAANVIFHPNEHVQAAANLNGSFITLGLAAPDENNDLQWKKFANNPLLEVVFSFPPNNATGLRVSNEVRCYGKVVTSDANPILYATASDNNSPPLMPALWHHVYTADETRWITSSSGGVRISSGSEGQWRIPPVDRLSDGEWKFRVYVNNNPEDPSRNLANPNNGGYSSWYPFIVRATPPRNAPGIRGDAGDYPANYWGAGAGAPGAIPVHTNFEPNVVGYTYTFLGSGTEVVPGGNDCTYNRSFGASGGWIPHSWYGQDFIPIPAGLSAGYHTVHVRSFDDAHNLSPESSHTFYVAPNTGAAARRVEAETMQLSGQGVQPQVLNNDCCAMSFSGGSFVMLPATTTGQSMTLRFSVTATGNYQLAAGLMSSYDFGQFAITLDGTPIGHPELGMPPGTFNGWTNPPTVSHRPLGTRRLAAGQHALTLTTTGTDPSSIDLRYLVAVDYLDLIPASRLEADDPAQVTVSVPQGQSAVPAPQTNCCFLVSWTQGKQLLFASNTVNGSFDLGFSVPLEADYALGAGLTKAADYGKLTLLLDGKPLQNTDVTPWDGYASSVSNLFVALGGLHLTAGAHTLTVKVVGTNPASTGDRYKAGVDYISAVPINNVTTAGFTQAMNNDGIVADTGVPADTRASLDLNGGYLSAQTLAATGYGPGAPVRIGGANFTMPTPRADGTDNVIAIGQTIPFAAAQQVAASAVGLLVTATCGSVPARTATLTYTDNTTQDTRLSAVEDWVWYVSLDPNIVTLPYRVGASGVDRTVHPGLRAVFLPADPTKTLKSITLPNYGSSLVPGSCSPALHVLAMAPRVATPGWIGAWTAPADATVPPAGGVGFANQTLRTIVHPTVTGSSVRIRVANPVAASAMTINAASIAAQSGTGAATTGTPTALTFGGSAQVTVAAGGEALSDPVAFPAGGGNLAVSLHLQAAVTGAAIHSYPAAPTYLATGNATGDSTGTPFTATLGGSRYLSGVDVSTSDTAAGTVAVLGDQLTAIAPAGGGTWVDELPALLDAGGVPLPGGLVNASRAGLAPNSHWRLDDATGSTARDSSGTNPATLTGGGTWTTERGGAISLNGANGSLATANRALVTSAGFTVSAWVKLNTTSGTQTVVSQDGTQQSGFALQYSAPDNKWSFTIPGTDTAGAVPVRVLSTAPAQTGVWTHLLATWEPATKSAALYLNGGIQNWAIAPSFDATGPLVIGRGKLNGSNTHYLNGAVSDVYVYQRDAGPDDARVLFSGSPVPGNRPGLGAPTVARAPVSLDTTVLNQPALRTVIVALGANDILAGRNRDTITQDLRKLMAVSSDTGLRNHRRTNGALVNVIITTVPALGLADNDPRELQRQALNADLLSNFPNYGAVQIVDLAAAVRDPAHPNQIDPALLTGNAPNAAYHTTIAQALTDAVTRFPPEATL